MLMDEIGAHKRTDAALQKAKEVAEAANVAKTRYIVGVSHEIRTPLNSIFGYAQLLERGIVGTSDNAIRVIRRSAEHMGNLIDGLLDISKIENGLLRLNRDRVHLVEFLDQIVDMFRLQAAAKGIEFRYQHPQHLPAFVHTDQKRLRQVLINLLSNAIKYTEHGHASLVVRYRSQVAEFEISDTGIGIPPEDLDRVFEPFERGNAPNVRSIPGTGLGLTITKLLTQIMGGEILARSVPGQGTTFTVRLLLSEIVNAAPVTSAPRRTTGYAGPPLKVLLIDDDPHHLDIVQNLLRPLGFVVFVAQNGRDGLALAAQCVPDLAMIDLSMPDMTGWETARQIRENAALVATRIVIVSANAHEYAPGGEGALHDAFVIKPIEMQALLDCIGSLFALQWQYDTPPATTAVDPVGILPNHSRHHIDDLYQLGRIGHVRGIQAKLSEIEAEDASNTPFAKHLRQLVANFDLKRYMNVLEAMRKNG
jgi:nitrogen-specific signal transduction histidine kinase/DNA-binding response OmpR family regulator